MEIKTAKMNPYEPPKSFCGSIDSYNTLFYLTLTGYFIFGLGIMAFGLGKCFLVDYYNGLLTKDFRNTDFILNIGLVLTTMGHLLCAVIICWLKPDDKPI